MFQKNLERKSEHIVFIKSIFFEFRAVYTITYQKAVQHNRLLTVI